MRTFVCASFLVFVFFVVDSTRVCVTEDRSQFKIIAANASSDLASTAGATTASASGSSTVKLRYAGLLHAANTQSSTTSSSIACSDVDSNNMQYLDSGAQANVFALDESHVLKMARGATAASIKQFQKECEVLQSLEELYPYVIRCEATCSIEHKPALILTRARGKAFKMSKVEGSAKFQKRAVKTMLVIGLAILEMNLVNTDQQSNILFNTDGTATFIDFGAAVNLTSVSGSFRHHYVKTYLNELFYLIPDSLIKYARDVLSHAECSREVLEIFRDFRRKRRGQPVKSVREPLPVAKPEQVEARKHHSDSVSPTIIRVKNDNMMCPEEKGKAVPCKNLPDDSIAECLLPMPSGRGKIRLPEVVYMRCCGGQGVLGTKALALRQICQPTSL